MDYALDDKISATSGDMATRGSRRRYRMAARRAAMRRLALRWIGAELDSAAAPFPVLSDLTWLERSCAAAPLDVGDGFVCGEMLAVALARLDPRSRQIVTMRRLLDEPLDLRIVAARHGISPHRAAMIEHRAFAAIQDWMRGYVAERRNRNAA